MKVGLHARQAHDSTSRPQTSDTGKPTANRLNDGAARLMTAEGQIHDQQRGDAGQRDRQAPENSFEPQFTTVHRPAAPRPVRADRQGA